ncbi:hypothetical protein PVAND_002479 [Polypedilum vanderplanki]|uniref:Uncharacterized protein n=1 Tax=Polypedilum vanderplanki TaxID=319348 RepID=A0A9J6BRH4_POLVA|nr:hypothetical protein PVAND_002479 [Polypedilum vanderplanki]
MSLKSSCSSLRNETQMPDNEDVLHRSFNQLLGSLDLPVDKIKEMNSYDNRKKWDILCSRSLMKVHQSPSAYLEKLRSHIRQKVSPSKETLRGLEVSLRTYSLEWLHEFLSEQNSLDIIANIIDPNNGTKLNLSSENFQIALQCVRVLLNDSSRGFSMTINHPLLFEALVANLRIASMKNRTLILQLLALACQKSENGQQRVLKALKANSAQRQLMNFLTPKCTHQMLIVAALNLIRMLLKSTTDMNYRIYLHYDFHRIGLDNRIDRLLLNESNLIPEVIDEINAYKSMIIDVNQLIRNRESNEILKEKLRKAEEKIWEMEKKLIDYEEKSQEVEHKKKRKDGLAEMSEECKVDKIPEVDSKAEISQKSTTVKIAPLMKGDVKEMCEKIEGKFFIPTPPPPPPVISKSLLPIPIRNQKSNKKSKVLPSLHWSPLRPNQIRGTIFDDMKNPNLCSIINFTHFENKFSLNDRPPSSTSQNNCIRKSKYVTLLDSNRLRNISIMLRKLNFDADSVIRFINDYDFNQLNRSSGFRLLTNLAPKDDEISVYRQYVAERKDTVVLSDEDKFLLKLSLVERLQMKLNVMEFMASFSDRMNSVTSQVSAISSASLSLESSQKFKSIVEIILTFGNYMNGNKSTGYAYGFHLCGTLEKLTEIRSNDKQKTLLEYIISDVIAQHFPQLLSFDSELSCIEVAARVSMKNVASEVENIENDWREMNDECDLSSSTQLKAFRDSSKNECNKLKNELEMAQNNYKKCIEYFGENSQTNSNEFFSTVEKFIVNFKAIADKVK